MKNLKLLFLLLCTSAGMSTLAIRIDVVNKGNDLIEVDPVWSGTSRGFRMVSPYDRLYNQNRLVRYDSGIYQLKGLLVRYSDGKCFYYFFEPLGLKGTGKVMVSVNADWVNSQPNTNHQYVAVEGHRDIVFQKQTQVGMAIKGNQIQCDRVNNFR